MGNNAESVYTNILGYHPSKFNINLMYCKKTMNLSSKTILVPSLVLLIGTVFGTSATNAFADDPFKNKVNIETDIDNKNSCDESQEGTNNAVCRISDSLTTNTFSIQGEKNKVKLDFEGENENDCDESGDGNNNAQCQIDSTKDIGPINIQGP
jgi:hypothetical protein